MTHQVHTTLPVNLSLYQLDFLIDGLIKKMNDGVSELLDILDLQFLVARP